MKYIFLAFKLVATLIIIWFILKRVDIHSLVTQLTPIDIMYGLIAGCIVIVLQAVIMVWRLQVCVRLFGCRINTLQSWNANLIGGLFNHTPISFVGGDSMRAWFISRFNITLANAAKAVIIDRIMGFIGIMSMVLVTAPWVLDKINSATLKTGYLGLILCGTAAILGFIALGFVFHISSRGGLWGKIAEYASLSRYLIHHPRYAFISFVLAILVNLFNVIAVWAISTAFNYDITFEIAIIAAPTVFLLAMMPISMAGWGVREGAAVAAFGLFGIAAEQSLAISISVGLAIMIVYSSAFYLLFKMRKKGQAYYQMLPDEVRSS